MSTLPLFGRRGKIFLMAGVASLLVMADVLLFLLTKRHYHPPLPPPRPVVHLPPPPAPPPPYDPLTDNDSARLIQLLANKEELGNDEMRAKAARRLGQLTAEAALPVLLEMLNDFTAFSSPEIRETCAWALGALRLPAAVPGLALALQADNPAAIPALETIGTAEAVDALTAFFQELARRRQTTDDPRQREIATALGSIKDKRAVPVLITFLKQRRANDLDTDPVFATVDALGELRDATAIPVLLSLDNGPPALKARMAAALGKILLDRCTLTSVFVESFADPANLQGWMLEEGSRRSIRFKDGGLSLFSSQSGDRVESYPHGNWTGEWVAHVRFRFLKGSGSPEGVLLFGKHDERMYRYSLAQHHQQKNTSSWTATVTRLTGDTEERLLTQARAPHKVGWNHLMVRNIAGVVSMLLNGAYLGSFHASEVDGQIGLGVANDNHVLFDDFQIFSVERERLARADEELSSATETEENTQPRNTRQATALSPPMRYRVLRRLPVRARPSTEAARVAWARTGMKICVVSVTDQWLEVRSTTHRPPGFISRDAAEPIGQPCRRL